MSNSAELINKQIMTLDKLNGHDGNPGSLLIAYQQQNGIQVPEVRSLDVLAAYEHMLPYEHVKLADGTVYLPMNDARSWELLEQVGPGALVGLTFSEARLDSNNVKRALMYEKFGVVSESTPFRTTCIGWHKVLSGDNKMQPWNLDIDTDLEQTYGVSLNEVDKAKIGITRLLDGNGVEGSQMTGVFNIAQKLPLDPADPISSLGCFSHDKPMDAVALNILRQTARPMKSPIVLDRSKQMDKAFIRLGVGVNETDYTLRGRGLPVPAVSAEILTYLAFERLALDVAVTNPQHSGSGTDPNHVFDVTVENAPKLVVAAQNGVALGAFQKEYRRQLSTKIYVP